MAHLRDPHPKPPTYHDPFHYEGEYQLFHCSFTGSLADIYAAGEEACTEHEKVLYPAPLDWC